MRTLALVLIALLAVVGVLFALGVFDKTPEPAPVVPPPSQGEEQSPREMELHGPTPPNRPAIEPFRYSDDIGVLLLAGAPQTFNAFLALQWGSDPRVDITSWVSPLPTLPGGSGPPSADALPGLLASPPNAGTLDDEDIDVLVLHDFDPIAVEDEFWLEVAKRVADGRLGLFAAPGQVHGLKMFEHPIVGPLLPVTKVKPIEGQPPPGVYGTLAPYAVTPEGERHPASRLVPWARWSRVLWQGTRMIETPWGTKFVYPVEQIAPGATVLLKTDPETGDGWPTLIVSAPDKGRVMWFGAHGLGGNPAYGRPSVVQDWDALLSAWLGWLTAQYTE